MRAAAIEACKSARISPSARSKAPGNPDGAQQRGIRDFGGFRRLDRRIEAAERPNSGLNESHDGLNFAELELYFECCADVSAQLIRHGACELLDQPGEGRAEYREEDGGGLAFQGVESDPS